jgi:signal recognition particle subunit SEC65
MTRISILTCLLFGALITSSAAGAETALEKGVRQYNARQFKEALSTLMIAAQQDNRNPAVHYNLGNAFIQNGDSIKAVREYELGYSLAGTGPIANYCRSALAGVRQRDRNSTATSSYRDAASSTSKASVRCPIGTESHHDGVQKVNNGLSPQEWAIWQAQFDRVIRRAEMRVIPRSVQDWQNMTGICELYYYVDRNRKLRARVNRSTTQDSVNAALLEVVRSLDGSSQIEFPPIISVDSFNFYHGVNLGDVALALKRENPSTTATMTSTSANLRQTGMTGAQGKLQVPPVATDVSAALRNPKITSDVAGKVISKNNTQTEMKATQNVLPPDPATQDVKGKVVNDRAQKNVSGQITDTSTQGKIEPPKIVDDKLPSSK